MSGSQVWNHFIKLINEKKVQCTICNKKLAYNDSSTKGMSDHLKNIHKIGKKNVQENDIVLADKENQEKSKQIKLSFASIKNKQELDQNAADEFMVKIMVRMNNAFTFFDDEGIQTLFKAKFPQQKCFGRKHYTNSVIPRMASDIRKSIKEGIGDGFFSITSDGWQKPSRTPALLSLTMHFVTEKFERKDFVIGVPEIIGEHTAQHITELIRKEFEQNELDFKKCVGFVRDDGSNFKAAAGSEYLDVDSYQCACHFLHLVVTDSLDGKKNNGQIDEISILIEKCKKWAAYTRTANGNATYKRHQIALKKPVKKIPMFVNVRWNSIYSMLLAILEQIDTISSMQEEKATAQRLTKRSRLPTIRLIPDGLPKMEQSDFDELRIVCKLLQPFDAETKRMSLEKSTGSAVFAMYKNLQAFLRKKAEKFTFAAVLHQNISERILRIESNKLLMFSMIIDCRFAYDEGIKTKFEWKLIEEEFIAFCKTELNLNSEERAVEILPQNFNNSLEHESSEFGDNDASLNEFEERLINNNLSEGSSDEDYQQFTLRVKSPATSTISSETNARFSSAIKVLFDLILILLIFSFYAELAIFSALEKPDSKLHFDIFSWWRENKGRFPLLAKASRCLLSLPATSVSSERLFSKAGLIYANTLRNRIQAKIVEDVLIIKANIADSPLNVKIEDEEYSEEEEN